MGKFGVFNATSSSNISEIQKYYDKETRFNGVYSRNNLRGIRDKP